MCSTNNAFMKLLIDELNIFKAINLSYLRILELNIKHQNSSGILDKKLNEILESRNSQASAKVNEMLVSEELEDCIIKDINYKSADVIFSLLT
ncbi:kinase-like domain-containing protein [Rhizophagus irregularis DAOM 181602=DAOM 197198]|uniref:Uncharacterized protein n=1 Tax=Rhizophagus irregularis (strain DAOM 181602 / DAOM 197198 / MUCL 43194) TaxID=747089 RepID=A0A2P4Q0Q6_RHIID|nr:hypothetical protein GLOIN_2v1774988 [Rhizophagus irregularis DAOM 181602=DAOM 197198]POG71245.1 hypothetical protein GLOIN_2v1774988 [Rhizophagus irregularis DAOM 181602=DAOM 197198]GET65887.1 kinase-like domain-containing protein [Rhizophagus irregularis DAOM 181602=DAOM 197198]|eukprot:XP_025178111.1 hypothetical protein GLOIN_2v1774988 [Rhizophagus irregularis DAOM 181602=DAOM 197198]